MKIDGSDFFCKKKESVGSGLSETCGRSLGSGLYETDGFVFV